MIIIFLLAGFLVGYLEPLVKGQRKIFLKITQYLTTGGLIILLISMGAKIGADEKILNQIKQIGWQALILALGSIGGSLLFVKLWANQLSIKLESAALEEEIVASSTSSFFSLLIVCSVIVGLIVGLLIIPEAYFSYLEIVTTYALGILLFGVGIDIGRHRKIFRQVKDLGWRLLIIPCLIAGGSIGGAWISGYFLGLPGNEATAVGAGFGWYSLSGIILTKIYSVELGSLAFLTNIFREVITFLILPFVVKYLGKLTAIAPGGATTMDVTLPLIKKIVGHELVIPAFISGVVLSILVPLLVPLLINL